MSSIVFNLTTKIKYCQVGNYTTRIKKDLAKLSHLNMELKSCPNLLLKCLASIKINFLHIQNLGIDAPRPTKSLSWSKEPKLIAEMTCYQSPKNVKLGKFRLGFYQFWCSHFSYSALSFRRLDLDPKSLVPVLTGGSTTKFE